jgi:hypothetical protein
LGSVNAQKLESIVFVENHILAHDNTVDSLACGPDMCVYEAAVRLIQVYICRSRHVVKFARVHWAFFRDDRCIMLENISENHQEKLRW